MRGVLGIIPFAGVELKILFCAFPEGDVHGRGRGALHGLAGAVLVSGIERVDPVLQQLPRLAGAIAGLVQREVFDRPEAHRALASAALIAQ